MNQLNAIKLITQHLMLGDIDSVKRCCQQDKIPQTIAAWGLATINQPLNAEQTQLLSADSLNLYQGWKHYYNGEYQQSQEAFLRCLDSNTADGIGLGIAKNYTRLGQWQSAKSWLLHELTISRQRNDLYSQAQCYGALGEIFLRSNHPKIAYECFGNAFQILPKGSSQREKQYNFQASALIRIGNEQHAEQYLMSAFYLAQNQQIDSAWHSLARLQFLWTQQKKSHTVLDYYADDLQHKPAQINAEGFLNMGLAFAAAYQQNNEKAIEYSQKASFCFQNRFPLEHIWAQKLLNSLQNQTDALELPEILPIVIPPNSRNSIIEANWQQLTLTNHGFATLAVAKNLDSLWQARHLFFI